MNKAFVKEPDSHGGICPKCGSAGMPVQSETLTAFVRPSALSDIAKSAFFCDFARCEVVYFDSFDRVITVDQVIRPVWPKDPNAPICGCFGLLEADVETDVRESGVARVRDVVQRSKTDEASCLTKSPSGQSCTAAVQRCYFRLRERRTS